jgi:hypothetical protein
MENVNTSAETMDPKSMLSKFTHQDVWIEPQGQTSTASHAERFAFPVVGEREFVVVMNFRGLKTSIMRLG